MQKLVLVQMATAEWIYLLLDSKKHVTGVAVANAWTLTSVAYTVLSYLLITVKWFIAVELVHERILRSKRVYFHQRVRWGGW